MSVSTMSVSSTTSRGALIAYCRTGCESGSDLACDRRIGVLGQTIDDGAELLLDFLIRLVGIFLEVECER